jgi:WD40 repeat protein
MPSACASTEELAQLLGGVLAEEQTTEFRAHLTDCLKCQILLDQLSDKPALQRWASSCRSLRLQAPEEPELARLLEKLRAAPPTEAYLGSSTSEMADASLTFLMPPEQEGDLGTLGPYRVLSELGRGGMGIVLLAYDRELRRTVALKVLPPDRADDMARARFVREARAAAGLDHDHIVPVYAVANPPDGPPYLVMPYIEGPTLAERIKAEGRLDPGAAARIGFQVAQGLAAAHRAGLMHRDIKPANIILDRGQGRAKIMDFGLARATALPSGITQAGTVLGTPEYMSPEQIGAPDRIDERTDVYSLGVTLYEALTGEVPFRGVAHLILNQVLNDDPRPPRRLNDKIARDLETICLHCMEKEPGKRYASAAALAEDLERFLAGKPIRARPTSAWERSVKWAGRRPAVAALLALVVFVTALGFGLVTWQWLRAKAAGEDLAAQAKVLKSKNYTRNISLAASELSGGNVGRAEELLDECPEELRGWEWRYLQRLSQAPQVTFPWGERRGLGHGADLAFSPADNRLLAAPSGLQDVTIWDLSTGRAVRTLSGHQARVLRLAFSPDGRLLASGSDDKTVKIWEVTTGRVVCTCPHDGRVLGLAFSPDGRYLASASADNWVKVWETRKFGDTRIAIPLHNFPGYFIHERFVNVAFSPDGSFLASGSEENTVKVWDVMTGREVHSLTGHTEPVFSVAFSADGRRLASKGWDGLVIVWDLATGRPAFPPLGRGDGAASIAWSMAFSPDGRRLAVGGGGRDGTVTLYDALTGQIAFTLLGHTERITCLAFSPDGRRLASASADKTVRLWDTETGEELLALRGHQDLVGRVLFDPRGCRLASSSEDGTVRIWDGTPLNESRDPHVRTLRSDAGIVYDVAFSRDSQWLASAGGQVGRPGEVKVWDAATAQELFALPGHKDRVFSLAFGPEGLLATASADGTVKFWDTRTRQEARAPLTGFLGSVTSMALSPDARRLATCDTFFTVQLGDVTTGQRITLQGHKGFVQCAAFSPDGKFVVTSGVDGTVRLWDAATGTEVRPPFREHVTRVHSAVFSPDSELVASGDADGKVLIWNAATGSVLHTFAGDREYVLGLAFSPDGRRLAAASWKEVKLWDLSKRGEAPQKLGGLAGTIRGVAFSPDGKYLAAGGGYKGKGEIKVWDRTVWDKQADK